jgi:hypothetical protein
VVLAAGAVLEVGAVLVEVMLVRRISEIIFCEYFLAVVKNGLISTVLLDLLIASEELTFS